MALQESPLTLVGGKTPRVVIYKSESHKLHQAFAVHKSEVEVNGSTVAVTDTIVQGQPVKLETDGTISPYKGTGVYLGIAVTNSTDPCYGEQRNFPIEVTVAVEGYMIVNWVAKAALSAGYVIPTNDEPLNKRYTKAAASTEDVSDGNGGTTTQAKPSNFIALNAASDANEVIQVLVK